MAVNCALRLGTTLTYLLIQSATPDPVLHERMLNGLHALEIKDVELNRDLLRARMGLLPNYDSLVQAVDGLHSTLQTMRTEGEVYGGAITEISQDIENLAVAVTHKETLVEIFKSDNALLQNSLMYFTHASHELSKLAVNGQQALAAEIGTLSNGMLRLMRNPQEHTTSEFDTALLKRLENLPAERSLRKKIRTLVAHGLLIVNMLPNVDGVLKRLLNAPTTEQARTLQEAYLSYYGQVQAHARTFRILLYLVSVALLAYLIYLFAQLRTNARALAEKSSVLQSRLNFESLITEISTHFINLPPNQVDNGIHHALKTLGEYAAVDRSHIFLFSADGTRLNNTHAWCRVGKCVPSSLRKTQPVAKFRGLIDNLIQHGHLHVPRVNALPAEAAAEKAHFQAQGIQSLIYVPLQCAGTMVGLLGFDAVRGEKHWSSDDITLLRIVGEIFANALERKRAETEHAELEMQLRQAQKLEALGTLAGGIAHDFNNILGAVLGYSEMAMTALPAHSRPRQYVQQVMTAGQRAKAVVDQILTFSRRGHHERQPVLVQPLIKETIELLRASLPTTIAIRLCLTAKDITVLGDPTQIHQLVMNLCTNAAQAMEGSGILDITLNTAEIAKDSVLSHGTLMAGHHVRFTVKDTGHGMDEATVERIFDPFFTTKAAGSGTGLGLSTVHGIVADHGGTINLLSRPGDGSTFEIYLPCAETSAVCDDEAEAPIPYGNGETILLIDDEKPLVLLGEEILAALGYEPVGFGSSHQALVAFRTDPRRFDLVLTDEVMPELTGTQLAAQLHAIRPELPIILMTGHGGPILPQQVHATGTCEVLRKPLQSRDLADSIARHLNANA